MGSSGSGGGSDDSGRFNEVGIGGDGIGKDSIGDGS